MKSYEWYKNEEHVIGQNNEELSIGKNRQASAEYTCKVVTENTGTSDRSDPQKITFLCQ